MLMQINNITKSYGTEGSRNYRKVLNGVSLKISEGESIAILGRSGSGKTTLLNILGSLDKPDDGTVIYRERDISLFTDKEMNEYRNNEIGFVFQFHHLLPQCSLFENLLIPTLNLTNYEERAQRVEHAISLMKHVGIYELRDQKPGKLSGGECQRTAVIRAMINSPSLLLADEPTGALDEENEGLLADLLFEMNKKEGVALILVTHSESLAAKMDSLYELKSGLLVKLN